MAIKVAINGFGRIGRNVARAILERPDCGLELVSINDLADAKANALLFKRDSVHGAFAGDVSVDGNDLIVDGKRIQVTAEKDPANLPHAANGIDIALECTGFFTDRAGGQKHLDAGAKRVLISAPAKGVDLTVVYGVNHDKLTGDHLIVSNASCTTNCLAPMAKVLHESIGIERGLMTTIHSYTNDQKILDQIHKDPRRARAAAMNMIPTSTGAAVAVGEVLPDLKGKLDGSSIRVPTPNVSVVDLTFTPKRDTTVEEVNGLLKAAAEGALKGVLGYTEEPLVSIDFNHDPHSSTIDSLETAVLEGKLVRVLSWYDNEWGFSNRMLDTAGAMAKFL
ncbi:MULTISPECIES: type I glyceraldehyde-3-phosphate dehydrogenase [Novosphingobium]|jgi:glyceraldehyde 3-phosphate dehydrogenase|uniref:Glyceraldehyde-3-phosphate dehydrogenase n=1 Tax=Novosphingobium subterraneum TaxID=48936 RepID=A0A0B9AD23_9SPHN|nr:MULTISPECIES: type I glyceraldehyde-3-phosphate dehydrogenase [Novosphingobium]KHS48502.1 glyceraldehyde-3-phosphate dehydrogenase [Novosphingobium subterraneum]QOV95220.1 type I glyceraldehyde-3-phosphate dehydrogenase [Novosphingobium sp. ES2-1]